MLIVDLIIAAIVVFAAVWGYLRGLVVGVLALIGFGGGAVLGSRVAPLILEGGVRSPDAPILALPGALLFGGLLATAMEALASRIGNDRRRRRVEVSAVLDDVGGPLLGAWVGLVGVWLVGAALVRIDTLRDPLRQSTILRGLNAALLPPGPLLRAQAGRPGDPFPRFDGPRPRLRPASSAITSDPQVRAAAGSVVKLVGIACGHAVSGSGWLAPGGIVVTNAHVVAGQDGTTAQLRGTGPDLEATPIWFDRHADIALLRVPPLARKPVLRLARRARPGTPGAILGFPRGGPYNVQPARLGPTYDLSGGSNIISRGVGRLVRVPTTTLLGRARPGSSGAPVVDGRGRVLTMIFGGATTGLTAFGVPTSAMRDALRRAGPEVGTGQCQ